MKAKFLAAALSCMSIAAFAQWQPGQGMANDHARGGNARDVVFVERGGGNPYGYRSYDTAIGLTVLPWSLPNEESSVTGLRLNFGWGYYAGTYGLDLGAFSNTGEFRGIGANWIGHLADQDAKGLQVGLVNVTGHRAVGLQIGLVNYVERLEGVQIGLLNFATSQWTLPFINIGW